LQQLLFVPLKTFIGGMITVEASIYKRILGVLLLFNPSFFFFKMPIRFKSLPNLTIQSQLAELLDYFQE
jgi:hypothetical protein